MKTIVIGAGSDLGIHIDGASLGPKHLISDLKGFYNGEIISLTQDASIIKVRTPADLRKNLLELEKFNAQVYNEVTAYMRNDYFPITIGGDHSISTASSLAATNVKKNIGLILLSANTNFNTFETTVSGNMQGLTLASIAGFNEDLTTYHKKNYIRSEKIVVIGPRDIKKEEKENLEIAGIKVYTTADIKKYGIENIISQAFEIAGNRTKGIHITYDLTIVDPLESPGISIPEYNGITIDEAININAEIAKHITDITSYDLVEYNPTRDKQRKTEQLAVNLISQILSATKTKSSYGKINKNNLRDEINSKF